MPLTHRGRIRKALSRPFPQDWRDHLAATMAHWPMLNDDERSQMEELIRILLVDKSWEATNGFQLEERDRVLISALACLLILRLDYDHYHRVTSIIVAPTTMDDTWDNYVGGGIYSDSPLHIGGEARFDGPILIALDLVRQNAANPHSGHNVVYHEFAHKLDMLDGSADGAPPMETSDQFKEWVAVGQAEYEALQQGRSGRVLDPYGATNTAEFFAVVTEAFFNKPIELQQEKPRLYAALHDFYRQDPARREREFQGLLPPQ